MKPTYQDALAYYGVGGAHPGGLTLTKKVLSREHIHQGMKILDAGCGTGLTSVFLKKTYQCQVTALDHNPIMVDRAKQRFMKEHLPITILKGSIEKLPFPDHSFDMVIAESVTAFTRIEHTMKEYYRVLKPGGILLNMDMTAEHPLTPNEIQQIIAVYGVPKVLTEEEWLSHFIKSGFHSTKIIVAKSVHSQLSGSSSFEEPEIENNEYHPLMAEKILEHQKLLAKFQKKLGYRVFRAIR
ncbi:class I SAM-dependent methyltransferase [Bacillus sp. FJAT-29790]|uniref:class I SAM-dependent methyltransferase n=1 Tax=Bacillus sp. FJAT-29790 TaxID=1895002 RepID=UPI001C2198A3|nr:class I SAM-dependent methyltransferase [Bacillus sp. FJAT-29790]MBU8880976.1 class I SAM-dependent methyltransferase [Bacillus sp. FJAT-29790]